MHRTDELAATDPTEPPGRQSGRGRRPVVAAAVVALVLVVAGAFWLTRDEESGTGATTGLGAADVSFVADPGVRTISGVAARDGDTVVFGAATVRNDGDTAAVLRDAFLVGDVPAEVAEVVEVRALDLTRHDTGPVGAARWPFERYPQLSEPLDGFTLEPGAEAEVLIVVQVHGTGVDAVWPQTVLEYDQSGRRNAARAYAGFQVCPPGPEGCAPPT